MSTELGFTADSTDRDAIATYMQRARTERAKAFAELFGFGFAVAKRAARKTSEKAVEAASNGPVFGKAA